LYVCIGENRHFSAIGHPTMGATGHELALTPFLINIILDQLEECGLPSSLLFILLFRSFVLVTSGELAGHTVK
jgi:hypothetical protein